MSKRQKEVPAAQPLQPQTPPAGWQQNGPPPGWQQPQYAPPPAAPVKRGLRKMSWFILVVQVLFVVWIIAGVSGTQHGTNCGTLTQAQCDSATQVGGAIGAGLIIAIWAFVDVILLVIWMITKPRQR